jgi:hypothetical protein
VFKDMSTRVRSVAGAGVIAALAVTGLAVAQSNDGSSARAKLAQPGIAVPAGASFVGKDVPPGAPPPDAVRVAGPAPDAALAAAPEDDLTYAEFHTLENGQEQVSRLDSGKIDSVSGSEISTTENDGNQVTIPVDQDTLVIAGREQKSEDVTALDSGQQVDVMHPEGGAADQIMVPPDKAELQKTLAYQASDGPASPNG